MTLIIEAPASYSAERRYVLDVVLTDWLGLEWRLYQQDRPDVRITLDGASDGKRLLLPDGLFGIATDEWMTASSLPAAPLRTVTVDSPGSTALSAGQRLPVIYGSGSTDPDSLVSFGAEGAELHVDVFGSAF